jgi:hypothetical protein
MSKYNEKRKEYYLVFAPSEFIQETFEYPFDLSKLESESLMNFPLSGQQQSQKKNKQKLMEVCLNYDEFPDFREENDFKINNRPQTSMKSDDNSICFDIAEGEKITKLTIVHKQVTSIYLFLKLLGLKHSNKKTDCKRNFLMSINDSRITFSLKRSIYKQTPFVVSYLKLPDPKEAISYFNTLDRKFEDWLSHQESLKKDVVIKPLERETVSIVDKLIEEVFSD